MMHPNWLLLAAILGLCGPLSLHPSHPSGAFARGVDRVFHQVGWREIEAILVCGEGDPLAAACR
jgi:hypothetical protein